MVDVLGKEEQKYIAKLISKVLLKGSTLVSKGVYEARNEACLKCPYSGKVQPLPGVKFTGCKLCGCPHVTKNKIGVLMRNPDSIGTPISGMELIKSPFGGEFAPEVVRCTNHEKLDFWAHIDEA